MVAVRVNPLDYSRASDAARRHATTLLSGVDQGSAALSRCYNMAGTDNGGESFAAAYDEAAATVMEQAYNVADGLNQWSGALISIAQIHSGTDRAVRGEEGHAPGLDSPMLPAATTGARPPSATGGDPSPIPGFDLVVDMVGYAWPNAQTGLLRDAANAWDGLASDLEAAAGHVRTLAATLASVDSPERALIETQLETFASDIDTLASAASGGEESLGHACRAYADQVDEVRDEALILLRDLALEIAAAVAASVALSFVTFGIGGVVGSAAIAARIVFVAGRIGPRFAALASRAISFAQAMRSAVASVRALGARGTIALNVVKQGTTEVITAQVTLPLFRGIVGAESRTPPALFTSFAAGGVGAAFSDLDGLSPVVPNSQMAGSNGHFLPGGRTAVTDGHGNFAILPLRELTVAGGQPMPPGSWAARLLSDGRWGVIGVFR